MVDIQHIPLATNLRSTKQAGENSVSDDFYRVLPNKKDSEESPKSILVAGRGFEPLTSWL